MKRVALLPKAFEDFSFWATEDKQVLLKILDLVKDIQRNPFLGIGRPEPLRGNYKGLWSRRINLEHRLVYRVSDEEILIVSCRFHYK